MYKQVEYIGQKSPVVCKNGPVVDRYCTDFYCCVLYIVLVFSVAVMVGLTLTGQKMQLQQMKQILSESDIQSPFYSMIQSQIPTIISIAFVGVLCLLMVITTFTIPAIATYIYIPLLLASMVILGIIFTLRYFGFQIPLIPENVQNGFSQEKSIITLITGLSFFCGFLFTAITMCTKRSKFSGINPVLRIARVCFWSNSYILIFSFIFMIMSIGSLIVHVSLLSIAMTHKNSIIPPSVTCIFIAIQFLWTHGFLQALSDFFCTSIAIHWYFKRRRQIQKQQSICNNTLVLTFKMMFTHIGSICFSSMLAYIPETLNTKIGKIQKSYPCFYNLICLPHRFTFRNMTKYCHFQTIMQSLSFCPSNIQMIGLRQRTKALLKQVYMMGNFYMTITKVLCVMVGLILIYFLIANTQSAHILQKPINILGPLATVLFGSLQISGHFINLTGHIGDTLVFMYSSDLQIQMKYFHLLQPLNCPDSIRDIINQVKAGQTYIHDNYNK